MKVKVIQKSMICLFNGENSVFPPFHPPVRPHLPPSPHPYFPPSVVPFFCLPTLFSFLSFRPRLSVLPFLPPSLNPFLHPLFLLPPLPLPVQSFRSLLPRPLIRSLFIYPSLPLLSRSFLLSTLPPFRRYSFIYSFNYESALFAHLGKSRTQRRERWNWCTWREGGQRLDGI